MKKLILSVLSLCLVLLMLASPGFGAFGDACAVGELGSANLSAASSKPAKVTSFSYTSTKNSVTLKWGKVNGASGYRIYQKDGNSWKTLKTVSASTVSYTVSDLKASCSYSFKIRSYVKSGIASYKWSDDSKILTCKTKSSKQVTVSSTSATKNSVTLKWKQVSGITGYTVYVKKDGKWAKVGTTTSCSYTIKSLKASTSYTFSVCAYKKAGSKITRYDKSSAVTVKTKSAVSTASVVSKYNSAVNSAKSMKNGTIKITDDLTMKCTSCSVPGAKSLVNSVLADNNEPQKTTHTIKNGKSVMNGETPDSIIQPTNKKASLSASDVVYATAKTSAGNTVITIKLKKETYTYNGKKEVLPSAHSKVLNIATVDDLQDMGVKSAEHIFPATVLTATVSSSGKLLKLVVNEPIDAKYKMNISGLSLSFTADMQVKTTYELKY